MSRKKLTLGKRPTDFAVKPPRPSAAEIDQWMEGQNGGEAPGPSSASATAPAASLEPKVPDAAPAPTAKMKRLTIDIPDSLHRRVKSRCGQEGIRMADVIRELLDQRFPE